MQLFLTAKKNNSELTSGFYVTKREPIHPICYKETKDGFVEPREVPEKMVFEVDGVGFGFLLMKMSALKKVVEKNGVEKSFHVIDPST